MFRWGQIGSASLVSLAHGTNDAQKSMGIILLALIASGVVPGDSSVPFWVVLSCALAMALGTYIGGWRVIRTLGKGLVELSSRQGMAAETSSAAIILVSSHFGFSLSTTHVATGSIMGSGVGMKGAKVRWSVAGRMFGAWLITVPCAAMVGAVAVLIEKGVGDPAGPYVIFALLVAGSTFIFLRSRRTTVDSKNVNDDWESPADNESVVAHSVAAHNPQLMRIKSKPRKKKGKQNHKNKHKKHKKSEKG
jgi:PiT family inorganic phosphate transporter